MHASTYLETEIATATPQRLRLMLIEGAIRFIGQTLAMFQENKFDFALEPHQRCRAILFDLASSVTQESGELARKTAGLYLYLYEAAGQAFHARSSAGLHDVLRVLGEERITWEEVCRRMPEAPDPSLLPNSEPADVSSYGMQAIPPESFPHFFGGNTSSSLASGQTLMLEG